LECGFFDKVLISGYYVLQYPGSANNPDGILHTANAIMSPMTLQTSIAKATGLIFFSLFAVTSP